MKYLGGKHEVGRRISDFIANECPPDKVDGYLEPFCGSLGVFKYMSDKHYKKYIVSDIHPDLILMWKKIQNNTLRIPATINEKEYDALKEAKSPNAMKAVAGFGLSFGGKYFGGYAQKWAGKSGRNFLNEFKKSIETIKPAIRKKNVVFYNKSYNDYNPHHMLIYCDPPYKSKEKYSTSDIDYKVFWDTMRKWSKDNCVFISEESAPSDFEVVFKLVKRRTLDKNKLNQFNKYDKVFAYKGSRKTKTIKHKIINHKTINKNNKTRKN
jgi:DNA adenine methylase